MFDIINEIINLIYQEESYQQFIDESRKINEDEEVHSLLVDYQVALDDYHKARQYEAYVNMDETKEHYFELRDRMSKDPKITKYYESYYEVNGLLDELTSIIFNGISDELDISYKERL